MGQLRYDKCAPDLGHRVKDADVSHWRYRSFISAAKHDSETRLLIATV